MKFHGMGRYAVSTAKQLMTLRRSILSSHSVFVTPIDTHVCVHDPYSCKQLQYMEQRLFNTSNTTNITTLQIYSY
jgi:hypothetical protein